MSQSFTEFLSNRILTIIVLAHDIQILSHLNGQDGLIDSGPIFTALRDGSLASAISKMAEHEMSSSIILALLELCVAKNTVNCTGRRVGLSSHVVNCVYELLF